MKFCRIPVEFCGSVSNSYLVWRPNGRLDYQILTPFPVRTYRLFYHHFQFAPAVRVKNLRAVFYPYAAVSRSAL